MFTSESFANFAERWVPLNSLWNWWTIMKDLPNFTVRLNSWPFLPLFTIEPIEAATFTRINASNYMNWPCFDKDLGQERANRFNIFTKFNEFCGQKQIVRKLTKRNLSTMMQKLTTFHWFFGIAKRISRTPRICRQEDQH